MPIVVGEATAPSVTGLGVSGGALLATSAALKRIYHVARGYDYADVAVTVQHRMNTTTPGVDYEAGVIARRIDAANQLVAYVTSGQLLLRKRDGDAMTDLVAPVAITALAAGTDYWLRLICEGNVLRSEHWIAEPSPMGTPAAVLTHTLAGGDASKFGAGTEGKTGIWWRPGANYTNARVERFQAKPYIYRNVALPKRIVLGGRVPGDLPALCDLVVTPSGGTAAPVSGLFGWTQRPTAPGFGVAPFGVIEAETASGLTGFAVNAHADARGGQRLLAGAVGPASASAWWEIDAGTMPADSDGSFPVDVFARVVYGNAYTGLKFVLWADPRAGSNYGARRYSDRGTAGLLPPAVTATVWRFVRLGRIWLNGQQRLGVDVSWSAGGGDLSLDYLVVVPARSFVSSPQGVALDSAYPRFVSSTAETIRTLHADGGASIARAGFPAVREHGLGRRIEMPVGNVDLVGKLSSLVIDRPEADAATEQLSHAATLHASITPRFAYA